MTTRKEEPMFDSNIIDSDLFIHLEDSALAREILGEIDRLLIAGEGRQTIYYSSGYHDALLDVRNFIRNTLEVR